MPLLSEAGIHTLGASLVIDNRELPNAELLALLCAPRPFDSPFTRTYPGTKRADAIATLRSLPRKAVLLDSETSGLSVKTSFIVEIGIVALESEDNAASTYIQPPDLAQFAGSKAQQVNGISLDVLRKAPKFDAVWPRLASILEANHLIVFNSDYDCKLLRYNARYYGIETEIVSTCLMRLSAAYYGLDAWPSLSEVAQLAGIDENQFSPRHTALADAKLSRAILVQLLETVAA